MIIDNDMWNLTSATKVSSIYLEKGKKVWFFDYHLLTHSVLKMVLMCLMQNIDMCLMCKSHQITRLVSHLTDYFCNWIFTM